MKKHSVFIALILVFANILGGINIMAEEDIYTLPLNNKQEYSFRGWAGSTFNDSYLLLKANAVGGCATIYNYQIPLNGTYTVSVMSGSMAKHSFVLNLGDSSYKSIEYPASSSYTNYVEEDISTITVESGIYEINLCVNLDNQYDSIYATELKFSPLKSVAVQQVTVNGDELGETVPRGADSFEVAFNNNIDEATIQNVKITEESGKNIAVRKTVDKNILKLDLLESFEQEKKYTLCLNGVADIYNSQLETCEYEFETSAEDKGNASVIISEVKNDYDNIAVSGMVCSSAGVGISGRTVSLSIKGAAVSEFTAGETVSAEEGKFEFKYTPGEEMTSGKYTLSIHTDYAKDMTADISHFTREYDADITKKLSETKTYQECQSLLSDNASILGIDPSSEARLLKKPAFYTHFIGLECSNALDIKNKYYGNLYLETINQATTKNNVSAVLGNNEKSKYLGVDPMFYQTIKNKDAFVAEVYNFDAISDIGAFITKYTETATKYIDNQFGFGDLTLVASGNSVYLGQKTQITFENKSDCENVKEIILNFKNENKNDITIKSDFEYIKKENNDGFEVDFLFDKPQKASGVLAKAEFIADKAGTYTVTVSGEIKYMPDEQWDFVRTFNVTEAKACGTVSESNLTNKSSNTSHPAGGGGGGGGSSSGAVPIAPVIVPPKQDDDNTEVVEEYKFNDLGGFEWAEDSIYELTKKNVIAKDDSRKFRPSDNITRAEFIKLLVMAFDKYDSTQRANMCDVHEGSWYYPYFACAVNGGFVFGDDDGNCRPDEYITRQDMAVISARISKISGISTAEKFADDDTISDYAKEAVYAMRENGIISGRGNNCFAPKENASRAESAKIIYGLLCIKK